MAPFHLLYNRFARPILLEHISSLSSPDLESITQQTVRTSAPAKQKWSLNQDAFDTLLKSFSADREQAGAQYEVMRRKLMRFFEWRSVSAAEECADETINRVARRIQEGQTIDNLQSYFYGVARMVFLEAIKQHERAPVGLDDASQNLREQVQEERPVETRLRCFDDCLGNLPPESRQLIMDYYQEERRAKIELRQELANRLHIPLNALRIRAHRIRMSLERCITTCMQTADM
jgi:RNA polymerase sigma factor (sigma-70 family)